MENKKRALGKGLEQLFNAEKLDFDQIEKQIYESASTDEIVEVNLDELRSNPYQPRKIFDNEALQELASSIKEHGVFQPIIIKKSIKGYDIIAGERRVKASRLAGKTTIPAIIRDFTDEQMMEIALLENLQRENLNIIEEAIAYQSLIKNLEITQEELSKRVSKSRSYITNILGLLRLPKEIQEMVLRDEISMGHARTLSKLESIDEMTDLAHRVVSESLTVRDIEEITSGNDIKKKIPIVKKQTNNNDEYKYITEALCDYLGTKVKVKDKKIEISFTSTADLNRILDIINVKI